MKKLFLDDRRSDGRDSQTDYAEKQKQKLNRKTVDAHTRLLFSLSPSGLTRCFIIGLT